MATGRVNVGGGGSGLNIYTQMSEPSKKEGIWLRTADKYSRVIVDTNVYYANEWINDQFAEVPYPAQNHAMTSDDRYVYISGGSTNAVGSNFYVYDSKLDTWTQLPDLPIPRKSHTMLKIGNSIYLAGGTSPTGTTGGALFYIFDISSREWSQLASLPNQLAHVGMASDGEFIYLTGGHYTGSTFQFRNDFMKYSIAEDVWELMPDAITRSYMAGLSLIGHKLYRYYQGSSSSDRGFEVFDLMTNEWSVHTNGSPLDHAKQLNVGTDIYLLSRHGGKFYKFNTVDGVYEQLPDVPGLTGVGVGLGFVHVGDRIHFMGGDDKNNRNNEAYSLSTKEYSDGDLIILRTDDVLGTYYTEFVTAHKSMQGLITRLLTGFNDVYFYINEDLQSLETHYGDGTGWIKIKEG